MTEQGQFMRFVAEFEVEILDLDAARAAIVSWHRESDGGAERRAESDEEAIDLAIQHVLFQSLEQLGKQAGFKPMGGRVIARDVEGTWHPPMTLPALPIRENEEGFPFTSP